MKHITRHIHIVLAVVAMVAGAAFWAFSSQSTSAQLGPIGSQILGGITSQLPTGNIPIITSPYVLDTNNIKKNVTTNNWDIPYNVPPNTMSTNFVLQINGTTLTGIPQAQILNGQLVFKVPDSAFAIGGTAMIGLVQKTPFQVLSLNAVAVLAQGLQPSPFVFNNLGISQNQDGSWNLPYFIPPNTVTSQYALVIGQNPPLTNGMAGYSGMFFRAPAEWFTSSSVLTLKLIHQPTGKIVAVHIGFVPESGPSPYILDQASIKQNENGTWDVAYAVPQGTVASRFSLKPGTANLVTNGAIVGGKLVFKVPENGLKAGSSVTLILKNETTGQVRATDTITVPAGLPPQIILNFPPTQNPDKSWRVSYQVPPNTVSSDYVLLVGTDNQIDGGVMVNDTLVFRVPENMFAIVNTAKVFVLKNIRDGRLYNSDGTVTQGVPNPPVDPNASKYVGGLMITFPPEGQTIKQNSATIQAKVRALVDLPYIDTTYIWNVKDGDPANNVEKQLIKIPGPLGMKAGQEQTATLTFTNLTPGQVYTFILRNKVTNTLSDIIQFKTPSNANEKSYLGYGDGYVEYGANPNTGDPNPTPPVVDDISDKGIVPKCGRTFVEGVSTGNPTDDQYQTCGYDDFLQLISNVLRYGMIILGPIIAVLAAVTGFQIIWYGRLPDPTAEQSQAFKNAKARMVKIAIGILIMLSGWVLIATITRELGVRKDYTFLDLFTGN